MPFASTSTFTSLRARSIPLLTASAISVSIYTIHTQRSTLRADSQDATPQPTQTKRPASMLPPGVGPYTPLVWGSNRYLTLSPGSEPNQVVVKKPSPLTALGSTPLRDLVLAEQYGACVDARGDCWMWGAGYDPSGEIGRSLKGKDLVTLLPTPGKVVALSSSGKLYAVSASKAFQDQRLYRREQSWWSWLFGSSPGVDFVELQPSGSLKWGEKFVNAAAGTHHLLAVTNKGRTFSLPLSPSANSYRQLGTKQTFDQIPYPVPSSSSSALQSPELPPEEDIRFETKLTEIPTLKGINVAQVAASDRTSFIRTANGKVLGFGANESGQIGLGTNATVESVQVPVEVFLAKNYPGGTQLECTNITAAGATTFFTVVRQQAGQNPLIDLLACGNGLSGTLGNGLWTSAGFAPVRVKTVSSLQEYSEKEQAFVPITIHSISASSSPSTHVYATLDTLTQAETSGLKKGLYGRDVMVWGGNGDYQLGNGKRSSLAVPQHLPPLIFKPNTDEKATVSEEAGLSSGTLSPMPHSRLQLHSGTAKAFDLDGKLIKRKVKYEETVVAGWNASALYYKIIR